MICWSGGFRWLSPFGVPLAVYQIPRSEKMDSCRVNFTSAITLSIDGAHALSMQFRPSIEGVVAKTGSHSSDESPCCPTSGSSHLPSASIGIAKIASLAPRTLPRASECPAKPTIRGGTRQPLNCGFVPRRYIEFPSRQDFLNADRKTYDHTLGARAIRLEPVRVRS